MYITDKNGVFAISKVADNAVLKIKNPKYIVDDKVCEITERIDCEYADEMFSVRYDISQVSENLFLIKGCWKNISGKSVKFQTIFETEELFGAEKYLIPCVSFNGNEIGSGNEPKGLECDGRPWVFAYDRVSIPSCTMVENEKYASGLFASFNDFDSMRSSCSVVRDGDGFVQRIIHPEKEAPKTYSSRDMYDEEYNRYIELLPDAEFKVEMYVYIGVPRWKNYGMAGLLDEVLDMVEVASNESKLDELWERSIEYAKSLVADCHGKKGFILGRIPDEKNGFKQIHWDCFELAWRGQNILLCRMLISDYIKRDNQESLDLALEIMDNWVECCTVENGLMAVKLEHFLNLDDAVADTCNLGYGAYEIYRVYELLKSIGIEKEKYFDAVKSLCDFFVENYSDSVGFGKAWSLGGERVEDDGTVGAFVILPMCKMYSATGEKKYLEAAEKAMEHYCKRDLDNFACAAGALDTCCVDKETSAPLIFAAIMLYEITDADKYLDYAKKAAYYFTSWMYHYSPYYEENCDIAKHKIEIKGFTAVSTQHHHVDCYAGIVVPYLYKLARYTKDEKWKKRADLMFNAVQQAVGDGKEKVHGRVRPTGSQNEAYFQCRWGFGETESKSPDKCRGNINDWLVAWMCAFRLSAIDSMDE